MRPRPSEPRGSIFTISGTPETRSQRPAGRAGLRDLMVRMGHDSERAAIIYQHVVRGADPAIAEPMDAHVQAEQADDEDGDDATGSTLVPAG